MKKHISTSARKPLSDDVVLVVVWNERIEKGLFRSQVVDVASKALEIMQQGMTVEILAFVPFYLMGFYKDYVRRNFSDKITIHLAPCPSMFAYFFLRPVALLAQMIIALPTAMIKIKYRRIALMHCRGYPAAVLGLLLGKILGVSYVFDMRSLFPEETVSSGHFRRNGKTHRAWKKIESILIENSAITLGVCPQFGEYIKEINSSAIYDTNYLAVDTSKYGKPERERSKSERLAAPIFVYAGSIGNWNSPSAYIQLIKEVLRHFPEAEFRFYVDAGITQLEIELKQSRIDPGCYNISTLKQKEIPGVLSNCDIGLQIMLHDPDRGTRFGVKVAEYMAAGLPVLVTTAVGGAASYISERKAGAVVDVSVWPNDVADAIRYILDNYELLSSNARECSRNDFEIERVAMKLKNIWINTGRDK